jgi:hypothetical protein
MCSGLSRRTAFSLKHEKLIHADYATKNDGPFYCAECYSDAIVRKCKEKKDHFAHKGRLSDLYKSGETELHKNCLDIKYVWVQGERRWYYLLSIMDVFSRKILHWIFQKSVRKVDVINMFRWLHTVYNLKGVIIRNDNGSQFLANQVRSFLVQLEAKQEFTHVATPEENAYIEAFHSILQRELIDRFEFSSFYEAKQYIEKYMQWYNYERKHRKLGRITPQQKWATGLSCSTDKQHYLVAEAVVSRPNDSIKNQTPNRSLCISLDMADTDTYLCLEGEQENRQVLHILNNDSVQLIGG